MPDITLTADQADHARKFVQISSNLIRLAEQLRAAYPDWPDFGRNFLAVALGLLLDATGPEETARYLREVADALAAGESPLPPAN